MPVFLDNLMANAYIKYLEEDKTASLRILMMFCPSVICLKRNAATDTQLQPEKKVLACYCIHW